MADVWRSVGPGDLVAAVEPQGPAWTAIVAGALDSGAALMPVDTRLTEAERNLLLERARPTHRVADGAITELPGGEPVPADTALVVATSGTSGIPKPVELTRAAIEAAVEMSAGRIGTGTWVACMPPAHVGGLLVFLRALLAGQRVIVHERFDPDRILAEPEADYLSFVPTMLHRLLDCRPGDLSRYSAIVLGGAGLPRDLAERAAGLGARVVVTYGLTESAGGVVYDGTPLEGARMRVLDGEVQLAGPTIMRGYRFDPASTTAAFTEDEWLRTGDAGEIGGGTLRVAGRIEDVVVTGAEKVWPHEVETALRTHPGVEDVAVTGRSDPEWGERVVAVVIPRDPSAPPTLPELQAHARQTLAGFKLPRELVLAEELPRTSSGKVRRARLLDDPGRP